MIKDLIGFRIREGALHLGIASFPEEEMPAVPKRGIHLLKRVIVLNDERGRVFWLEGISAA